MICVSLSSAHPKKRGVVASVVTQLDSQARLETLLPFFKHPQLIVSLTHAALIITDNRTRLYTYAMRATIILEKTAPRQAEDVSCEGNLNAA